MISSRYVPAICVLLAMALVPTLIHSYGPPVDGDGWSTRAIPDNLEGYIGSATSRSESWGARRFDSKDWIEREYTKSGDSVRLTVVRSEDAKSLYHHPELAIAYGPSFVGVDTHFVKARPDLPIHVLKPGEGSRAHALYVLHYDGRFVDRPVIFQLRASVELLFSRRKPMTIFFALDENVPEGEELESWGAARLLVAAVDSFTAGR